MPISGIFDPIPAAVCLLDLTICADVRTPDLSHLLHATILFIVSLAETIITVQRMVSHVDRATDSAASPALEKLKLLASRTTEQSTSLSLSTGSNTEATFGQPNHYISDFVDFDNNTNNSTS
jgi:hypothetical protein